MVKSQFWQFKDPKQNDGACARSSLRASLFAVSSSRRCFLDDVVMFRRSLNPVIAKNVYLYIYTCIYVYTDIHVTCPCEDVCLLYTSSTAQGGGGSFKNRKPIGEVGCCESGMAKRIHWWTKRCLRSPLCLSLSLTIYLPIYLLCIYLSIYLAIYLSLSLFHLITYLPIYLSTYLPIYLSTYLSIIHLSIYLAIYLSISLFHLSICLAVYLSIYLSVYLSTCLSVAQCHSVYCSVV